MRNNNMMKIDEFLFRNKKYQWVLLWKIFSEITLYIIVVFFFVNRSGLRFSSRGIIMVVQNYFLYRTIQVNFWSVLIRKYRFRLIRKKRRIVKMSLNTPNRTSGRIIALLVLFPILFRQEAVTPPGAEFLLFHEFYV